MIRRTFAVMAALALSFAGAAFAHEGPHKTEKMMGTVKAVHAEMNHVEITTATGTGGFYVDASTKYVRGNTKPTLADLKPGTRVVATVKTEGDKKIAVEVRLSGSVSATAAKPAGHSH